MKAICLRLVLLLCIATALEAQRFPSLEAAPEAYDYARRIAGTDGGNWRDLAGAALWASSVNTGQGEEQRAAAYMDRIIAATAELDAANLPNDAKTRGEYALGYIHQHFLKSYSAHQTRVDEIFKSGRYNCVSSAVLYMVLASSLGLEVEGVITKDHAFATVNIGSELVDVETTNRYGFDPGNRKEFLDAFGRTTGFAYVPAGNYRDRAAVNKVVLVSLILSNRIAALEQANRFADAIPLSINRAVLLSANNSEIPWMSDPWQEMMTRLSNLGAYYIRTGKEDDAMAWAIYAEERYPDIRWQELFKTAAHNKLVKLIRAKKISDAYSVLAEVKPRLDAETYAELETMVLDADATEMVNAIRRPGDAETALAFLAKAWERLPPQRRDEMRTTAILAEVDRLGRARDWAGSIQWLNNAITQYGSNSRLQAAFQACRQNRISELHNEFANLYNSRNYAQAKASTERSLQEFPDEQQFINNLQLVEKALQR